ncbi:MAG: hypothetical protein LBJ74_05150 [Heliobacteriaceae bacterium]|jgi:hypothetical protein|nr:hypothetical protein [Heliobacteriaceae bacterium]
MYNEFECREVKALRKELSDVEAAIEKFLSSILECTAMKLERDYGTVI